MPVILFRGRSAEHAARQVATAAGWQALSVPAGHTSILLRWNSQVPAATDVELNGVQAMQLARDKIAFRRTVGDLAPRTWTRRQDVQLPAVVRPQYHAGGRHFYVCRTQARLSRAIRRCGMRWYATELIRKRAEYRVFVLQGRVVAISQRFPGPDNRIAWNLRRGGRLVNLRRSEWPTSVATVSLIAAGRCGLNFGAMDVLVDGNGHAMVLEANTSPGLRNLYTIESIGRALAWLAANNAEQLPPRHMNNWKGYIHPALRQPRVEEHP